MRVLETAVPAYTACSINLLPAFRLGPNDLTCPCGRCDVDGKTMTGAVCFCSRGTSDDTCRRASRVFRVRSMYAMSARSERVAKVEAVPRAPARPVRPTR